MSPRVLTVGETMALLDPVEDGPLELGRALTLRVAGAESMLPATEKTSVESDVQVGVPCGSPGIGTVPFSRPCRSST